MMGVKLTPEEAQVIRDMHAQGYNDFDIAEAMDRSERTIWNYRRSLSLPALPSGCRKRVADLHERGMIDKEIAEALSRSKPITPLQISEIRRSLGKEVIRRTRQSGYQRRKASMESTAYEKYTCRQLKTDAQIARLYGDSSYA